MVKFIDKNRKKYQFYQKLLQSNHSSIIYASIDSKYLDSKYAILASVTGQNDLQVWLAVSWLNSLPD
jgi:hypothetical protein